jgi:hypothetical protein
MKRISSAFIPEIWSQRVLSKFYADWSMFEPVPHFVITLTAEIKRLSEAGLTSEEIAEKIGPEIWERDDKVTINIKPQITAQLVGELPGYSLSRKIRLGGRQCGKGVKDG